MLEVKIKSKRGNFAIAADFDASNGVTALIGPSGAGKSSFLRLIAGLDRPTSGVLKFGQTVWFDEKNKINIPTHKRRIGMVFQSGLLLAHRGVRDNIKLGARGKELDEALLEEIGCTALMDKPVSGLSGGEQQRVMLGRALAGNPQLLLMDEPLSALDTSSKNQILSLLARLLPSLKIPVIYVTHGFEEASRLTEVFARMENGIIGASGSAAKILTDSALSTKEMAISSVLEGEVASFESGGIAKVKIGQQLVEVARNEFKRGEKVRLRLWARDLILAHQKPQGISARNALVGRIGRLVSLARGQVLVEVNVEGQIITSLILSRSAKEMKIAAGQAIFIIFKSASIEHLIDIGD